MSKISFVGAHDLMVPYINKLAETNEVSLIESGSFTVRISQGVELFSLPKTLFGFEKLIKGEVSEPWYLMGLNKKLRNINPETIVVLDFIRFWYWQVIWYRFKNPTVKIILYTETQRVPKSLVSRFAFKVFEIFFIKTSQCLSQILTFTDLGYSFINKYKLKVPISVAPAMIDTEIFKLNPEREYLPGGVLRILMNARYTPYKRHLDLINAYSSLLEKGVKATLTFIGRSGDGRSEIIKRVNELNLARDVTFLESVPRENLSGVYSNYDVLVLPSDNEAIGMVVPEAMACGLPTITSDTVGANVYVEEGKTGFIFKTKNINELENALVKLHDKKTLETMGKSASDLIFGQYCLPVLSIENIMQFSANPSKTF